MAALDELIASQCWRNLFDQQENKDWEEERTIRMLRTEVSIALQDVYPKVYDSFSNEETGEYCISFEESNKTWMKYRIIIEELVPVWNPLKQKFVPSVRLH